ncbi:integrase [Pseudorhodoferax soli]|nr:integrase [Pseudorhodoferax soli]
MSSVILFYRFLQTDVRMRFTPDHPPWNEKDVTIALMDSKGRRQLRTVASTDLAIREKNRDDPFLESIMDGGKLRPLARDEQKALVAALKKIGNQEYFLMHCVALLTGAREMTALTLPWGIFAKMPCEISWPLKIRCGPGTGIDTKNNATNVWLSIPQWLYMKLHMYAISGRAERRRARSKKREDPSNYLFLTSHGGPYYECKDDVEMLRASTVSLKKSSPIGQNLREFIKLRVIPEVQKTLPNFTYRYHDLRATFGLNWVDSTMGESASPEKFSWARDQLRKLLWHKSAETTDRYLTYRGKIRAVEEAQRGWEKYLTELADGR